MKARVRTALVRERPREAFASRGRFAPPHPRTSDTPALHAFALSAINARARASGSFRTSTRVSKIMFAGALAE